VTIILCVEGETERYLPAFLQRWVNPKLAKPIAIKAVNFRGVGNYMKDFAKRSSLFLEQPGVIAVVGLIDFYGSGLPYPEGTIQQKYRWAKQNLEAQVDDARFRQHFAVHETEAWLFAAPEIFPGDIIPNLPKTQDPETINSQNPPSHRLTNLYQQKLTKKYKKPIEGSRLFAQLDPERAYTRCPHLRLLLDEILLLGQRPE
jgi:hypothetical protein